MKRVAVLAAVLLAAAGCGDKPVPERGTVTDAKFTPAGLMPMPGPMICTGSGTSQVCVPGPMTLIPYPDEWRLEITDLDNPEWVGTVEVDQAVYQRCNLRELWPTCADETSGDTRG